MDWPACVQSYLQFTNEFKLFALVSVNFNFNFFPLSLCNLYNSHFLKKVFSTAPNYLGNVTLPSRTSWRHFTVVEDTFK